MKKLTITAGLILTLASSIAQAVPTLFFNGDITYDSTASKLHVTSDLFDTYDIAPVPDLMGTLDFDAGLLSNFSWGGYTVGSFGTTGGADDLTVKDANTDTLLTGNFDSLTMSGLDGTNEGAISGSITATGGSLASYFGIGQVIAVEFNLTTNFSSVMFDSDFSGLIDGRIEGEDNISVPEPAMVTLLSLGVLLVGFVSRKRA